MNKIFSIIIPSFNCEQFLEKTLRSLLIQDNKIFECIIVDGSSTDKTMQIVKQYYNKKSYDIKYISEPDKGVYDAMNKGIDLAEGEYLYFIGAGDTLVDNILSKMVKYLNFKSEIVYGNVKMLSKNMLYGEEFTKEKISVKVMWHQSIFYNKDIFQMIGKYNLKYKISADSDFNIRCFGVDAIEKRYVDLEIANYLGGGLSDNTCDEKFLEDYKSNIINNLGEYYYRLYLQCGKRFYETIQLDYKKAILIGDRESIKFALNDVEKSNKQYNKNFKFIKTYNINEIEDNEINLYDIDVAFVGQGCQVEKSYFDDFKGEIIQAEYFTRGLEFIKYIDAIREDEVIVFGTSNLAERLVSYFNKLKNKKIDILYFLDNNENKHNKKLFNKKICNPNKITIDKNIKIIVASTWFLDIKKQLLSMGVEDRNIISVM